MKKKIAIALVLIMTQVNLVLANGEDQAVSSIPVRFLHNISSRDINQGDAIPLEIIHDINIKGHKVFAQGGAGYAYVDEVKKARWMGRGGKLSISRGVVVDVLGNTHNVFLSNDAKGEFRLGGIAGAISLGAVSSDILELGGRRGSVSGTILGIGSGLGAASLLMSKGNEATIGKGKVMFASLASPIN